MTEAGPDQTRRDTDAEPHVAKAAENDDDIKSKRVTLADLSAKGTALYAQKSYEAAADIFSTASTLQASINGETAPENAEILFHYGRSLFKVGQSKSDVLGGPATAAAAAVDAAVAAADSKQQSKQSEAKPADPESVEKAEPSAEAAAPQKEVAKKDTAVDAKKPLFQFTGDDNFDQDDDDDDDEDGEGNEDEADDAEDDELATSFEILDLARVCYLKQLEQLDEEQPPGKAKNLAPAEDSPAVRHVKERLADTHDCLAEISLENERYHDALEDGRISLQYKMELYPEDSEIVAEAHYKLSLALEFASVTTPAVDEKDGSGGSSAAAKKRPAMDQELRDEAVREMKLAIKSFRLKLQNKEVELATMASPEDNEAARKAIAEMKDVVVDMEQRLVDLGKDAIDATALLNAATAAAAAVSVPVAADASDEAKLKATDLTSLVRKKSKTDDGKRKAEEPPAEAEAGNASPKKPRLEDDTAAA